MTLFMNRCVYNSSFVFIRWHSPSLIYKKNYTCSEKNSMKIGGLVFIAASALADIPANPEVNPYIDPHGDTTQVCARARRSQRYLAFMPHALTGSAFIP